MPAEGIAVDSSSTRPLELPGLIGTWQYHFGLAYACRAALVSMSAARMLSKTKPGVGDDVTVNLAAFNPLAGKVADILTDGFILEFCDITIDDMIDLVLFARQAGMTREHEGRAHIRVIPKHKLAHIEMENGRQTFSRIIDVSRAGIAIETPLLIQGELVKVGGRSGRVVRAWEHGAAIQFDEVIDTNIFSDQISFR